MDVSLNLSHTDIVDTKFSFKLRPPSLDRTMSAQRKTTPSVLLHHFVILHFMINKLLTADLSPQ